MSQPTYSGKTWEQLTAWEQFKFGLFRKCAVIETSLTTAAPFGFVRGDIDRKWTGYGTTDQTQPEREEVAQ